MIFPIVRRFRLVVDSRARSTREWLLFTVNHYDNVSLSVQGDV